MSNTPYDLIVLGAGSGGLAGALRAASHGARVALLEPHLLGGTCVNVGCVPKKAMWIAAESVRQVRRAAALGIDAGPPALDWAAFVARRQHYIEAIHAGYAARLKAAGVTVLPTRGRFVAPRTIECADGARLTAPHVLIATGARPWVPEIPGASLGGTSDTFFEWTSAPPRVAIVGGGYIAVELAGVLQALGSMVTLYVRGERLLAGFDAELTDELQDAMRHAGCALRFGTAVEALSRDGAAVRVHAQEGIAATHDAVLFATGREPATHGLGLDQAGIATDARGHVVVDADQCSACDGVHAVGDVTAGPALTPVAVAAARRLMDRVFGGLDAPFRPDPIPTVVFGHPPLGRVGMTEAEARDAHGDDVQVLRARFRPMAEALAGGEQRSLFKVVCAGADRRVLGLHLLGEGADEILQGFAVALRRGITLDDLRDTIALHPTSAEEIVLAT